MAYHLETTLSREPDLECSQLGMVREKTMLDRLAV